MYALYVFFAEYLYRVLKHNNCTLPEEALYMVRYVFLFVSVLTWSNDPKTRTRIFALTPSVFLARIEAKNGNSPSLRVHITPARGRDPGLLVRILTARRGATQMAHDSVCCSPGSTLSTRGTRAAPTTICATTRTKRCCTGSGSSSLFLKSLEPAAAFPLRYINLSRLQLGGHQSTLVGLSLIWPKHTDVGFIPGILWTQANSLRIHTKFVWHSFLPEYTRTRESECENSAIFFAVSLTCTRRLTASPTQRRSCRTTSRWSTSSARANSNGEAGKKPMDIYVFIPRRFTVLKSRGHPRSRSGCRGRSVYDGDNNKNNVNGRVTQKSHSAFGSAA